MTGKISANSNLFWGPASKALKDVNKNERSHYSYIFNETISLKDEILFENNSQILAEAMGQDPKKIIPSLKPLVKIAKNAETRIAKKMPDFADDVIQELAIESTLSKNKEIRQTILFRDQDEKYEWKDLIQRTLKYAPSMEDHLLRRVQHFLLQITVCYGTGFHFEVGKTQDQAESTPSLKIESGKTLKKVCKRNSAHSSTFPCLRAYDLQDWKKYKQNGGVEPQSIDFLKWSSMYKRMNSTVAMSSAVNTADLHVDGWHHDSEFSVAALKLINKASKGKITHTQAMKAFLKALETQIVVKSKSVEELDELAAITVYLDEIKVIKKAVTANTREWIFGELGIKVDPQTKSKEECAALLKLTSESIQRDMRGQSQIMKKVVTLAGKVFKEFKAKQKKAPNNYIEAFKRLVINAVEKSERAKVEHLFVLREPKNNSDISILNTTKAKINKVAKAKIKQLAEKIVTDMNTMRKQERKLRGSILKELRESMGLTRKDLVALMPSKNAMNKHEVAQIEECKKTMSNKQADCFAAILDVPSDIFTPRHFYC